MKPFEIPEEIASSIDLSVAIRSSRIRELWSIDQAYAALFESLARQLHRGRLHHAILVAEAGLTPESLLTEFAQISGTATRFPFLRSRQIVLIDARFTLPRESRDRLLAILSHVARSPSLIVCIVGFASCLRCELGTNRDVLLSALGSVACQLVAVMTPVEYEELVAGDADLEEYFANLVIPEPNLTTSLRLVNEFARTLHRQYEVQIPEGIALLAANLASSYILHERMPGKVHRILRRVCQDIVFDRSQLGIDCSVVTEERVFDVVSQISGVPSETLRGIATKQDYEESLREHVVGQCHAVKEIATELGLIKAGLTDAGKPASVMMFVGQTGTGKTEMAKALSRFYSNSKRLRTYTLGNMVESHSVSAIIGVPPGYVGHDRGGKIVQDLQADPHGVFLLDEADKAHPDVLQPFLNLFDEGWIRDQRGVQAYANNAIFILTTNVGQRMIADMTKQGKSPEEMATRMKETLAQIKHPKSNRPVFAPEFLARIKRVIVFQPLTRDAMHGICIKLIKEMQRTWKDNRGKHLEIADLLVDSISEEAHRRNEKSEGREGGRIVRKLLSEYVDAKLQQMITDNPEAYQRCQNVLVRAIASDAHMCDVQTDVDSTSLALSSLRIEVEFSETS